SGVAPSKTRPTSGAATSTSSGATGQYVARFEIRTSSFPCLASCIDRFLSLMSLGSIRTPSRQGNSVSEGIRSAALEPPLRYEVRYIETISLGTIDAPTLWQAVVARHSRKGRPVMNIFYIIGVIVVVLALLGFLGLR